MKTQMLRAFFLVIFFVAVCVVPAPAQGSATRVEQNDPAIVYSGNWYSNGASTNSGGGAVLTNTRGARASITFTGTGISWIAYRDEWSGVARVYLDGVPKATIDNYLSPSDPHAMPYSTAGLSPGPHTLTIEVTGTRNSSSKGSWIWIDGLWVVP